MSPQRPQDHKRVQQLAEELRAHGVQSEYLARVDARLTREQRLEDLQTEIAQEIASALGRTDMRVNMALAELELCRARYERATDLRAPLAERQALAEAFNAQRLQAQARVRELLIHREACGFRRNALLNELYPVPAKLPLPQR